MLCVFAVQHNTDTITYSIHKRIRTSSSSRVWTTKLKESYARANGMECVAVLCCFLCRPNTWTCNMLWIKCLRASEHYIYVWLYIKCFQRKVFTHTLNMSLDCERARITVYARHWHAIGIYKRITTFALAYIHRVGRHS